MFYIVCTLEVEEYDVFSRTRLRTWSLGLELVPRKEGLVTWTSSIESIHSRPKHSLPVLDYLLTGGCMGGGLLNFKVLLV